MKGIGCGCGKAKKKKASYAFATTQLDLALGQHCGAQPDVSQGATARSKDEGKLKVVWGQKKVNWLMGGEGGRQRGGDAEA